MSSAVDGRRVRVSLYMPLPRRGPPRRAHVPFVPVSASGRTADSIDGAVSRSAPSNVFVVFCEIGGGFRGGYGGGAGESGCVCRTQ